MEKRNINRFLHQHNNLYSTIKLYGITGLFLSFTISLITPTYADPQSKLPHGVPFQVTGQAHILYIDDFEHQKSELQVLIDDDTGKFFKKVRQSYGERIQC